jgi:hypothetical protein
MTYARDVVQKICHERRVAPRALLVRLLDDDTGDYDSEVVSLLSLAIGAKDCARLEKGTNPIWYRPHPAGHRRQRGSTLRLAAARWGDRISGDLLGSQPLRRDGQKILYADFTALTWKTPEFDVCLTSPPYLNRLDYVVAHLPELSILQLAVDIDLEELRKQMIGTTKIVTRGGDYVPQEWGPACRETLHLIANHSSYASRRYYYHTYFQYFERLYTSLNRIHAVMRPGCKGLVVLQDSYYKDLKIRTPQICVEMLQSLSIQAGIARGTAVRTHMGQMSPTQMAYAPQKTLGEYLVWFAQ